MRRKYKVGLIDDEQSILDILIYEISMLMDFEVSFSTVDPVQGLEYMRRGKAEILITDILMPELGGLEISRRLLDSRIPVIICSGHSRYAIHGFKVDALDFLGKPPNPLEVTEALLKAKKKIDSLHWVKKVVEEDFVVVGDKLGHVHNVVKPTDILYMEQRKKVSIVKLEDGSVFKLAYPFVTSMAKLKSPYMIRVHHSFAVNILKIRTLFAKHCKLVCGEEIPISASFREEVRRIFENKRIN